MTRYVAFLRAINVGGRVVKMDQLRTLFEEMGFANVKTFIASGNVLFDASTKAPDALERKISKLLRNSLGYDVDVFLRTHAQLEAVCARCQEAPEGGSVFVGFLPTALDAREKKIVESLATPVDNLQVHEREVYWQAAKNFSDAIFQPARMEKQVGKPATFRNATTVRKITALLAKAMLLLTLFEPVRAQWPQDPVMARPPAVARPVTLLREGAAVHQHVPGGRDAS